MTLTEFALVAIPLVLSTLINYAIMQAVLKERLKNVKETMDNHISSSKGEASDMKKEVVDTMTACRATNADKINGAIDYIKRVEANKADRSEMNLVIDTMKRVEQKLDLLIMRDIK